LKVIAENNGYSITYFSVFLPVEYFQLQTIQS